MQTKPNKPKADDAKRGVVRFRCTLAEKARWVRQAQKLGRTLTQHIKAKLNGHGD